MSNFRSLKYFKNKNNGKTATGIVLNLIKIEKIEKIATKKKYSCFSSLIFVSENFKK